MQNTTLWANRWRHEFVGARDWFFPRTYVDYDEFQWMYNAKFDVFSDRVMGNGERIRSLGFHCSTDATYYYANTYFYLEHLRIEYANGVTALFNKTKPKDVWTETNGNTTVFKQEAVARSRWNWIAPAPAYGLWCPRPEWGTWLYSLSLSDDPADYFNISTIEADAQYDADYKASSTTMSTMTVTNTQYNGTTTTATTSTTTPTNTMTTTTTTTLAPSLLPPAPRTAAFVEALPAGVLEVPLAGYLMRPTTTATETTTGTTTTTGTATTTTGTRTASVTSTATATTRAAASSSTKSTGSNNPTTMTTAITDPAGAPTTTLPPPVVVTLQANAASNPTAIANAVAAKLGLPPGSISASTSPVPVNASSNAGTNATSADAASTVVVTLTISSQFVAAFAAARSANTNNSGASVIATPSASSPTSADTQPSAAAQLLLQSLPVAGDLAGLGVLSMNATIEAATPSPSSPNESRASAPSTTMWIGIGAGAAVLVLAVGAIIGAVMVMRSRSGAHQRHTTHARAARQADDVAGVGLMASDPADAVFVQELTSQPGAALTVPAAVPES